MDMGDGRAQVAAATATPATRSPGRLPNDEGASRRQSIAAFALTVLAAMLTTLVLVAVAWRAERADRAAEYKALTERAEILSRMFASHVERTFRHADVLTRLVADSYVAEGERLDLHRVVKAGTIPLDVFLQLAVVDGTGMVRASTLAEWKPVDVSDRAHIKALFDRKGAPDFVISTPLVERLTEQPTIFYSRAIVDAHGHFHGVASASLAPSFFGRYFAQRDLGERGVFAVFGTADGVIRVRRAGRDESSGQRLPPDSPILVATAAGRAGVLQSHASLIDGIPRTFGYAPVPGLPLGVAVGLDGTEALAQQQRRATQLWETTFVAIAATLALAFANLFFVRRWAHSAGRQARAEMRGTRLAERLSAVTEASPDGVLVVASNGNVEVVNASFLRMAAVEEGDVLGVPAARALQAMAQHRGLELPAELGNMLEAGSSASGKGVLAKRAAPPALVHEIRFWAVHGQDTRVISIRDVTAEHEMQQLKSEFVTTAAHELRTPMASVLGFSELLLDRELPNGERREAAAAIHRQASRLTTMLNDFLDLARVEARAGLDFRFATIDLVELAERVVGEFRYMAPDRTIEVERVAAEPVDVRADAGKLEQVLHNLLDNAAKYSQAPAPIRCRVGLDATGRAAIVEVVDGGVGMSAAERERVFDGFYRADQSGRTVGTGLGLRLSRRILEVHDGSIELDSEPGRGTVARIRLPRLGGPDAPTAPEAGARHAG